jgi:hypothetical protein
VERVSRAFLWAHARRMQIGYSTYGLPSGPRITPFASLRGAAAAATDSGFSAAGSSLLGAIFRVWMWESGALLISKLEDSGGDVCALESAGMLLVYGNGWHPRGEESVFVHRGSSMWIRVLLIVSCVCVFL